MAMTYALKDGMKVVSSDGKSLGKIIRIEATSFLVEKGFFFPKDYAVPITLVRDVRDDECWLSIASEELERVRESGTFYSGREAGRMEGAEQQRLTLSEEELEARKRVREAGEVQVRKEVVTEHQQIDVPVMKEEVHVERMPGSTTSAPAGETFKEETVRVPVREEEIEVTKRPRVREEVRVSKTARQQERRVEGDVRREEAHIDRTDDPERKSSEEGPLGEEPPGGFRDDEK